jgi:hypothetical protein
MIKFIKIKSRMMVATLWRGRMGSLIDTEFKFYKMKRVCGWKMEMVVQQCESQNTTELYT